ncbi:MAG TPA: serine/threonine phosphatase [Coleofasciculaceae cyanobacterium]
MLVCPQCQFENPNTNKFCQRCGTSLTHKTCYDCGTSVPINAETCFNCGAFTGTVWWAIISKDLESLIPSPDKQAATLDASTRVVSGAEATEASPTVSVATESQLPQPETSAQTLSVSSSESSLPEDETTETNSFPQASVSQPDEDEEFSDEEVTQPLTSAMHLEMIQGSVRDNPASLATPHVIYLDTQQRYRVLDPLGFKQTEAGVETYYGTGVRVLDCQPFQKSPLEALMEQKQGSAEKLELAANPSASMSTDVGKVLGIPAIAQPYLALKKLYYQTLPAIHDAWQQDEEAVVLLEDRSTWQLLTDLWDSEEIPSLQILYWLDEMAKLWEALEPWHCRQSLLEVTNLRVDEDQALGLIRLYPDLKDEPMTLQDLGQLWQRLFDQSQRTQFSSLGSVFRQMCNQEIGTVNELRSHLEAIAREQEASAFAAEQYYNVTQSTPQDNDQQASIQDEAMVEVTRKSFFEGVASNEADELPPTVILPMQLLSLDDAGCTDIGQQRPHNEDSFCIRTQVNKLETPMGRSVQACGLYVLCDGMGGHSAGEVASGMAVETLKRYFQEHWTDNNQLPSEDNVREGIRLANQAIYEVNQKNARSGSSRMGTTLAMMLIQNTNAVIAHVGDSRVYRLTRKRGLEQMTVDHEVGQRELGRGVDPSIAYSRPDAYQLTQALGPRSDQSVHPDVQYLELNEDTLFIICSDGLSDNDLMETHWQTHLAPLLSSRANLDQGILQLIELANEHNGHDNITVILIRVKVRPDLDQQQFL